MSANWRRALATDTPRRSRKDVQPTIPDRDWVGIGNVCHAMSRDDGARLLPAETRARVRIDQQLTQAGWKVQDRKDLNLFAAQGIAVREVVMKPGHGRVDYLLYVDKAVVGVIEAKPMGTPLSGVEWQSAMYADGLPAEVRLAAKTRNGRLPFVFEASGVETHFTNGFDPEPRARLVFNVPKPATLARILRDADASPEHPTWRAKVRDLPCHRYRPAAPSTGQSHQRNREESGRSAVRPITGTDGDRGGQDLHRGHRVLPAAETRWLQPDPFPGRPQQPRRPDAGGVPELPHAGRRSPLHRAVQRRQAFQRRAARLDQGDDLDHPAGLQVPQRRGSQRR